MRITAINHAPFENPGYLRAWAERQGHVMTEVALYDGASLPVIDALDWLVVMGGPMGVRDDTRYPWLAPEKRLIAEAIDHNKIVLGICFGAQLVGQALGAAVNSLPHKEIGWFPVEATAAAAGSPLFADLPLPAELFHWHGEMVDVPQGALHIARSVACANQIFTWGDRVAGLQCHPEMTPEGAAALVKYCVGDLDQGPWVQSKAQVTRDDGRFDRAHAWMDRFLVRLENTWKDLKSA